MKSATKNGGRGGFTLVELAVVAGIIAVLLAILMPVLARARMQSQIVRVHSDLRQITMALQMYATDNKNHLPPTRFSCASRIQFEMPMELAQYKYLPGTMVNTAPGLTNATVLKVNYNDPFDYNESTDSYNTYLYRAPGTAIVNEYTLLPNSSSLYVPYGYPAVDSQTGQYYFDPKTCPVRYVVWSVGPNINSPKFGNATDQNEEPIPSRFWCMDAGDTGVIMHAVNVHGADVISP